MVAYDQYISLGVENGIKKASDPAEKFTSTQIRVLLPNVQGINVLYAITRRDATRRDI